MAKPLHFQIPHWIIKGSINNKLCANCNNKIKREHVIAMGIRTSGNDATLFLEYQCQKCKYREIITITSDTNKSMTIEDLCFLLLDSIQKQKETQSALSCNKKKKKSGGKITDKEVSQFLEFMNRSEHYEDLLKHLRINTNNHGKQNTDES